MAASLSQPCAASRSSSPPTAILSASPDHWLRYRSRAVNRSVKEVRAVVHAAPPTCLAKSATASMSRNLRTMLQRLTK